MEQEAEPLLGEGSWERRPYKHVNMRQQQLSVLFAVACIVDQFGIMAIITLPRVIILCGWLGFPLAVAVFSMSMYTSILLARCWVIGETLDASLSTKARYPFPALVHLAWGDKVGTCVNWYSNMNLFTSNIPTLVIASQNLQQLDSRVNGNLYILSYCYWLIILGAVSCPFTWLGSPKDLKWSSMVSCMSVVLCAVLTWLCMIWDDTRDLSYRAIPTTSWSEVAIAFGNLAFQLVCHPVILVLQNDMKNKSHVSFSIIFSFLVSGCLLATSTLLAVFLYGAGVKPNLTDELPNTITLYSTLCLITLQLFLSTIMGGCPLFQDIEEKLGVSQDFCWQRCAIRTVIVMCTVLLSEMLPRFDLVMGLLGGLFAGPLAFILPPLMYCKLRSMLPQPPVKHTPAAKSSSLNFTETTLRIRKFLKKYLLSLDINVEGIGGVNAVELTTVVIIVIFGVLATGLATYFSGREAVMSAQFTLPCLFNVTAASMDV